MEFRLSFLIKNYKTIIKEQTESINLKCFSTDLMSISENQDLKDRSIYSLIEWLCCDSKQNIQISK